MANIQERRNKEGKLISYSIRVHRGRSADGKQLKPYTATFEVQATWSEKTAKKRAEAFASTFERDCKAGLVGDGRQRFEDYCNYCIELKEQRGLKHSTITRYKELTERIYPAIGHIKVCELRADHLNVFYSDLAKSGVKKSVSKATAKFDVAAMLKAQKKTQVSIAEKYSIPISTIADAVHGKAVRIQVAQAVAEALGIDVGAAFEIQSDSDKSLSSSTIRKYHNLISTVLDQAVKEGLAPFNVAERTIKPKEKKSEAKYFQIEEVAKIRDALEAEPIKWKTFTHLLLITGARRGEILGLKWDKVDFDGNRIRLCNTIMYRPDVGIYEETPKTQTSVRYVTLPVETMQLLRQYRAWQASERLRMGECYQDQGFVFTRDDGRAMHPDSVNRWLKKFSERHKLPHIHPHAFRHTMASMLYYNQIDSVSISKRLGHAQVSTTANIYAHVIAEADQRNADVLSDIFLKRA